MTKIAVSIETKDRRIPGTVSPGGENYLGATLRNFARAGGFSSPHLHSLQIVSGGELEDFFDLELWPNIPIGGFADVYSCPEEGRTRQQNGALAIRVAAATDADYVLKLEDDLDFCADFIGSTVRWLERHQHQAALHAMGMAFEGFNEARYAVEGESVLGPGTSFARVRSYLAQGLDFYAHPAPNFWGAQAVAFTREMAQDCVMWLGDDPFYWNGQVECREVGHDFNLGLWCRETKLPYIGAAIPSFVQHIGRQSSLATRSRFFEFPWPGRDWSYV